MLPLLMLLVLMLHGLLMARICTPSCVSTHLLLRLVHTRVFRLQIACSLLL